MRHAARRSLVWRKANLTERQRAPSTYDVKLSDGIDGVMWRTDQGIDDEAREVAD